MEKRQMLSLLAEEVSKCTKCPELVESRTQTVFGVGNVNARVLLLGEGPGEDEDKQGEPFVGQAGKLLNNIIKACGWKREDVYICNIVKCRPPYNRTPKKEESDNCRPFLELQIKIVNPTYILCLGNVAAQNLLKTKQNISSLRGEIFTYKNPPVDAKVICTFHPSFALHNGNDAKRQIWDDMEFLLETIKKDVCERKTDFERK